MKVNPTCKHREHEVEIECGDIRHKKLTQSTEEAGLRGVRAKEKQKV